MFQPARLLGLAALALGIYVGFFAIPGRVLSNTHFDPATVADYEAAAWQSLDAREDFGIYFNLMMMLRTQHQYSWFRAAQAAFYTGRAMREFPGLMHRYERVLPDLEAAATIEKNWKKASFDPGAAARAQLNWWVTRKVPDLNSLDSVGALMAEEYGLRYERNPGHFTGATALRAQAAQLHDDNRVDPDWPAIRRLLAESYRTLREVLLPPGAAGRRR